MSASLPARVKRWYQVTNWFFFFFTNIYFEDKEQKAGAHTVHVFRLQVETTNGRRHVPIAAAALRWHVGVLSVSQGALRGQIAGDICRQVGFIWSTITFYN